MIDEKEIINRTYYGLYIYNYVLSYYYPNQIVLNVAAKECKPAPNPYNDHKLTLKIVRVDNMFSYFDTELPDFKGNAFDFASLHFKLSGRELLERINQVLYLELEEKEEAAETKQPPEDKSKEGACGRKFSFFKGPITNTVPYANITLADLYKVLTGTRYMERTELLRTITKPLETRKFKAEKFEYVTFSGTFKKRSDAALIRHSGLMVIDIDHVDNVQELKEILIADKLFVTEMLFCSPSGNGLKWVIAIDLAICDHLSWFNAVAAYLKNTHNLTADKSGKDISRACFIPWDPQAYINPRNL